MKAFDAPFRHWVIDAFAPPVLLPSADLPDSLPWATYSNDCERGKRTCNNPSALPFDWRKLLLWLNSAYVADNLPALTGVQLQPDPSLYGAGIHITDPGGHLNCHLDYNLHTSGLERRANVVLFLNREWREEWGGAFELWDDAARQVVKRICPAWNRAVVWEASDLAYHGAEETTGDAPPRVTACAYFLAQTRPGTVRKRALFCPRR